MLDYYIFDTLTCVWLDLVNIRKWNHHAKSSTYGGKCNIIDALPENFPLHYCIRWLSEMYHILYGFILIVDEVFRCPWKLGSDIYGGKFPP